MNLNSALLKDIVVRQAVNHIWQVTIEQIDHLRCPGWVEEY